MDTGQVGLVMHGDRGSISRTPKQCEIYTEMNQNILNLAWDWWNSVSSAVIDISMTEPLIYFSYLLSSDQMEQCDDYKVVNMFYARIVDN